MGKEAEAKKQEPKDDNKDGKKDKPKDDMGRPLTEQDI